MHVLYSVQLHVQKLEKENSKIKEKIEAAKELHIETETQLQEAVSTNSLYIHISRIKKTLFKQRRKLKELQDDFQEQVQRRNAITL